MMATGPAHQGFVPGRYPIDAYGGGGFRFAEMSHRGSIIVLPSGIKAWAPTTARTLAIQDFAPIFAETSLLELVLVGTGLDILPLAEPIRRQFHDAGIGLDVMQTGAAARTYNILLAENRQVGAALIAVD